MKPILFTLLFLTTFVACAQEPLTFTGVVKTDSTDTKEDLFNRAKVWFATYFKDSKEVLQIADKESGELMGRGVMKYSSNFFLGSSATKGYIWFDVHVYCKPGRFKYEITNFRHEGTSGYGQFGTYPAISFGRLTTDSLCPPDVQSEQPNKWRNNLWREMREYSYTEAELVAAGLKKEMIAINRKKQDDW